MADLTTLNTAIANLNTSANRVLDKLAADEATIASSTTDQAGVDAAVTAVQAIQANLDAKVPATA